jgi:hypothetical protein
MVNDINQNMEMVNVLQVYGSVQFSSHGTNPSMASRNVGEEESQFVMIKQGVPIKMDFSIQGNKIISNATWKTKVVPGSQGRAHTGLGVHCEIKEIQLVATILIQDSTAKAPLLLPLHAQALALLLATTIAHRLQAIYGHFSHRQSYFVKSSCISKNYISYLGNKRANSKL